MFAKTQLFKTLPCKVLKSADNSLNLIISVKSLVIGVFQENVDVWSDGVGFKMKYHSLDRFNMYIHDEKKKSNGNGKTDLVIKLAHSNDGWIASKIAFKTNLNNT